MFHVGAGVLAKTGVVPEDLICYVFSFSICLLWLVRTVGCSGIRFRRVLSGVEERLRLLMPAGMFFVLIGGWLLSRWTYCSEVSGFVNG